MGGDPDIVFEHPGRQTMGASVFACKRAGTIVTCAATSGYMIEYDNRHLWMKLKTIKGSHFANYREAWDANQLVCEGKVLPPLSAVYPLEEVGEAAYQVHHNLHEGKIGVLCLAPEEGLGHRRPRAAGQGRRGPHHPVPEARRVSDVPADRDRPRGHRGARPRGGHRLVRRGLRRHRGTPRARRVRRRRGGPARRWPTPTCSCSPRSATTRRSPSTWPPGARGCTTSATGSTTARVALQAVKDAGGRVIDEAPRPGSRGTTVAFVHPKTSFGTLIELVQE